MSYHIFFSPQVKRCATITYKHGMCELRQAMPNDFRFKIRKYQESLKTSQSDILAPSPRAKIKF